MLKSIRSPKNGGVTLGLALLALSSAPALADHHEGETAADHAEMSAEDHAAMSAETDTAEAVTVGGVEMLPTRTIIENASNSPIHSTLVAAVEQAQLVDTLSGPGPFTVFAPTDEAFAMIPENVIDALMQDAARAQLSQILTYHVIPGALDAETLTNRIEAAGGELTLTTVEGSPLVATIVNGAVALRDETGVVCYVTQPDVTQSNGVIHVVNGVLIPEAESAAD